MASSVRIRSTNMASPSYLPPSASQPHQQNSSTTTTSPENLRDGRKHSAKSISVIVMLGLLGVVVVLLTRLGEGEAASIPAPSSDNHTHQATVAHINVLDEALEDPRTGEKRLLRVTLFMPVPKEHCTKYCILPYMPKQTAQICNEQFMDGSRSGVFDMMSMKICCGADTRLDASVIPVVVLEAHSDTTRFLYSSIAQHLTANGVAVLLMDHPRDTLIAEIPDKPDVYNNGSTPLSSLSSLTEWNSTITKALDVRTKDIQSALQLISTPDILIKHLPYITYVNSLDTSTYSIIGHGLGGTLATQLSILEPARVRFSINLSGSAPPLDTLTSSTIYFLGRANFRREHDIHWPITWRHFTGRVTEFDLADSEIMDFTDLPLVVELAKYFTGWKDIKARGVGTSGARGHEAVKCFVEGIMKSEILGSLNGMELCVREFGNMVPYMRNPAGSGKVGKVKRGEKYLGYGAGRDVGHKECDDEGKARSWRTILRQKFEVWGFS